MLAIFLRNKPQISTTDNITITAQLPAPYFNRPRAEYSQGPTNPLRTSEQSPTDGTLAPAPHNSHGQRHNAHAGSLVVPTPAPLHAHTCAILVQICLLARTAISVSFPTSNIPGDTGHITQSPISAVVGGDMGRTPQSRAQEKDVAFQETAQTDGGQGAERRHISMPMSGVRWCQEDARAVPGLHEQ